MQNNINQSLHSRDRNAGSWIAMVAACVILGWQNAPAEDHPANAHDVFNGADVNGDGKLSEDEFKSFATAQGAEREEPGQGMPATKHQAQTMRNFQKEDADGDGYISADELSAVQP